MKILANLANHSAQAAQSFDATSNIGMFVVKPIKVAVELLSALSTYEKIQSLPSFTFVSELTSKAKENLDGTFGILGILKFTLNAPANLLQLKIPSFVKNILTAVPDLKNAQDAFNAKSATWIALPSRAPLALVSKALQWNISPQRLLLVGGLSGAWQIGDSLKSIKNWSSLSVRSRENRNWRDVSHALTIAEAVTNFAYNCFKVLGNSSRSHRWAKFGFLAASTGFKIAAFLVKPSEKTAPAAESAKKSAKDSTNFQTWLNPTNQQDKDKLNCAVSHIMREAHNKRTNENLQADTAEEAAFNELEQENCKEWQELKTVLAKINENNELQAFSISDQRNLDVIKATLIVKHRELPNA